MNTTHAIPQGAEIRSFAAPCGSISTVLKALDASSEGSAHIAIYQQIDHNDDGNNPTTVNREKGMRLVVAEEVQHDIDNLEDQSDPICPWPERPQSPCQNE